MYKTVLASCVCVAALAQAEPHAPPLNPYLANSPWPMSHHDPYNSDTSPLPGPEQASTLNVDFVSTMPVSITLNYSPARSDGSHRIYGNTVASVFRLDANSQSTIKSDSLFKTPSQDMLSGAYTVLDKDGRLYVPMDTSIAVYTDTGKLTKLQQYALPQAALRSSEENIVGLNMTFDGRLAFATSGGTVGVLARDFSSIQYLQLPLGEEVSNSIAVDENGGIFIVTNRKMHRVQWNGSQLSLLWSAAYEHGPDTPYPGRLGTGSGSTPTLMGTAADQEKFVVFTDGQKLMHLVFMWRDKIPANWNAIAPGKDRRIAAEVPITFGDASRTSSTSEQSVVVQGYGAMVVNNEYRNMDTSLPSTGPLKYLPVLLSGQPQHAPYGVEKFIWDPRTQTLRSSWANQQVSCPNGIPTVSAGSHLAYCIGARNGSWTLEAMNWDTGASVFYKNMGSNPKFNSVYAATEIGPNREIVTGSLGGVVRLRQGSSAAVAQQDCSKDWSIPFSGQVPYIVPAFPDGNATYWTYPYRRDSSGALPVIKVSGRFPYSRYMSFNLYDDVTRNSIKAVLDRDVAADAGSVNPFVPGVARSSSDRNYTLYLVPEGNPLATQLPNAIVVPASMQQPNLMLRVYLPDQDREWDGGVGLPKLTALQQDASTSTACPAIGNTALGLFNLMKEQASKGSAVKAVFADSEISKNFFMIRAGGAGLYPNIHSQYLFGRFDRDANGYVADIRFRAPGFTPTLSGSGSFNGQEQARYWSMCLGGTVLTNTSQCLTDETARIGRDGMVRLIIGPEILRSQATRLGANFLPWGLHQDPLLILRHLSPADDFSGSVSRVPARVIGQPISNYHGELFIGDYAPTGKSCSFLKVLFGGNGCF